MYNFDLQNFALYHSNIKHFRALTLWIVVTSQFQKQLWSLQEFGFSHLQSHCRACLGSSRGSLPPWCVRTAWPILPVCAPTCWAGPDLPLPLQSGTWHNLAALLPQLYGVLCCRRSPSCWGRCPGDGAWNVWYNANWFVKLSVLFSHPYAECCLVWTVHWKVHLFNAGRSPDVAANSRVIVERPLMANLCFVGSCFFSEYRKLSNRWKLKRLTSSWK